MNPTTLILCTLSGATPTLSSSTAEDPRFTRALAVHQELTPTWFRTDDPVWDVGLNTGQAAMMLTIPLILKEESVGDPIRTETAWAGAGLTLAGGITAAFLPGDNPLGSAIRDTTALAGWGLTTLGFAHTEEIRGRRTGKVFLEAGTHPGFIVAGAAALTAGALRLSTALLRPDCTQTAQRKALAQVVGGQVQDRPTALARMERCFTRAKRHHAQTWMPYAVALAGGLTNLTLGAASERDREANLYLGANMLFHTLILSIGRARVQPFEKYQASAPAVQVSPQIQAGTFGLVMTGRF